MASKTNQTYTELTGDRLSATSMLKMFNIMEDTDGTLFMNIFRSYTVYGTTLSDAVYFQTYEAENDEWWELISNKLYNTVNLWWVVCTANNVVNPFEELEPGKNIKVLHERFVPQLLREIRNISEQ